MERTAFFLYLGATLLLLLYVLRPFAVTMMVAAVISVLLRPLYGKALEYTPRPRLWAVVLTLGIILLVLAPATWVTVIAIGQVGDVVGNLRELAADADRLRALEPSLDRIAGTIGMSFEEVRAQFQQNIEQGAGQVLKSLGQGARQTLGATASLFLNLFILIFAIYTFLIHADTILAKFKSWSPLDDRLEDELIRIFRGFSYGIVLGGFVTAIIQGIVGGIGYAIFGVSEAFFWGVLTGLFSFVPFVGTAIIWIPLAVSLFLQDQQSAALGLAVYSVVITGSVDNFVKPWLMGQNSSLNPLVLFLSIFGGLMTLGAAGILIGPVTASFFLALAKVYESDMAVDLQANTEASGQQAKVDDSA